ncbi:Phospholipase D delta like [Actinidia chinensis var. chinensis]|uniref:Phospholipase D n=1 Tax=Actinidia chinensis var. chinensis TaxID=1590841 RepID=A0A2R6S2W9_ACTCC|nr:Phospholipase D delta like [Actinidia chinensis var. chinensis]
MATPPSKRVICLYGDLDLKIVEARNLPNMDLVTEHLRRCFTLCGAFRSYPFSSSTAHDGDSDVEDNRIDHHAKIITSDPYVKVCVPQAILARTRVIPNAHNPVWNERFHIPLAHPAENLEFQVKDNDLFGAQMIGRVLIEAERLASGEHIAGWFPVDGSPKPDAKLYLEMKFTPCEQNLLYKHGIAADPERKGVRHTYFPLRKGGDVVLYQDAHVRDECQLPKIDLDGDNVYEQGKCWEDLCHAISEAHHLIYIVGWSIYHKVRLIREPTRTRTLPRGGDLTLGDLLKSKSAEGVRVLLLVWDGKTSHDKLFFNTAGVMQTHDEETMKFFKHSSVKCVLSPRYASSKLGYIKQKVVGTAFTHHQKCVLVDMQAHGNNRKITAFLGGLDLRDGRYDTPEHRLFCDLDTVFYDDYHNPTFPPGTKAPRQPWHDLHCKIDGPAAYDVLINFEELWKRATKWTELGLHFKKIKRWHDDALIRIERISWILSPAGYSSPKDNYTFSPQDDPKLWVSNEGDPENWHVQIFRSIDSGSVKGFPRTIDGVQKQNLVCSKHLVIDKSIQTAYIQAIRSAKHFIYIENQYFIGSSYAWPSYKDAGADNLVPMELALKITSKIKAKERFAVYVVIPMWPEGDPNSAVMQEVLFWQNQTMQMMYGVVAQELKSMQLGDSHPQDYLNFYCLGKREKMPEERVSDDAEKFQRFMIYVHAKGMVVDDEYVIVGSANINQRSLAGTNDTEIAMGAYQPHHTWAQKMQHPHGQIYGYRMSLWAEHLGTVDKSFHDPETLECVKKVNQVADDNWTRYTAPDFMVLQGHLLKYPVLVDADGKVGPLPGYNTFPDVGGKVLGSHSPTIPDVLTT